MRALFLVIVMAPLLGGCVGLAVGAVATSGVSIAEERTLGRQIDDLAITFSVSQRLHGHGGEALANISVNVTEGRVLLTGSVPEFRHRIEAARLAWQAEGVTEVSNEITVGDTGSIEDSVTDAVISAELRGLLLTDPAILNINYNVETANGVVFLTGIAQNQGELDRVLDHARTISGVEEVVSYVRVKDG